MVVEEFVKALGADFYTGVPDSQLKALCGYLISEYGIDKNHHVIAANEGNCVGIATGYHLATGRVPVVYMQNSGEGNVINPTASLLNKEVYGIPVIFVIGWRGEPDVHDEPQHIYQGKITLKLLEDMDIENFVLDRNSSSEDIRCIMDKFRLLLDSGKQVAFVVKKGGLEFDRKVEYSNNHSLIREKIIEHIIKVSGDDPIISTTGKTSRELFELREACGQGHGMDFLTVGSMGHSSSIALGVAINKPDRKVWCIDGDGAAIMHMGAMAVIGAHSPDNLVHIVINNEAHESVGGMPTVAGDIDLIKIAEGCGYKLVYRAESYNALDDLLKKAKDAKNLTFIEIKCGIGARDDLGRPTTTAADNKKAFMDYLKR